MRLAGGNSTSQVTDVAVQTNEPHTLEVAFSSEKTNTPSIIPKNERTHVT